MILIPETPERIERTEDNFIRTFTGGKFWPLNPRAVDVRIEDVAHSLSQLCRFTGHTRLPYSVAEHSVRVSWLVAAHMLNAKVYAEAIPAALWGLLHDASEAYLTDLPSPLKRSPHLGPLYRGYESLVMEAVIERFALLPKEPVLVKACDRIMLATEERDLMKNSTSEEGIERLPETLAPWSADKAEHAFLRRYEDLIAGRI
jgi:hypothetical protein